MANFLRCLETLLVENRPGQIEFIASDFSGTQFYLRERSATQKNDLAKPKYVADQETTGNFLFVLR